LGLAEAAGGGFFFPAGGGAGFLSTSVQDGGAVPLGFRTSDSTLAVF